VQLEVVKGDITRLEVDAIANAANDRLWMGAGVAGAIKRAGGQEIEDEAVAKGPVPVGSACPGGVAGASGTICPSTVSMQPVCRARWPEHAAPSTGRKIPGPSTRPHPWDVAPGFPEV